MADTDDRPRVATAKAINLRQLADEVGGPLSAGEGEVVAALADGVTQGQLAAAIEAHTPNPDYGLTADALTLRELRAKTSLTASEVGTAVKLFLKGARP